MLNYLLVLFVLLLDGLLRELGSLAVGAMQVRQAVLKLSHLIVSLGSQASRLKHKDRNGEQLETISFNYLFVSTSDPLIAWPQSDEKQEHSDLLTLIQ